MIDELLKPSIQQFIEDNEAEDAFALSLKFKAVEGVPIAWISGQIAARQIAKQKYPAWYACRNVVYPIKLSLEQSSSQITAHYKASLVSGDSFIDLTGGMGLDSWALASNFNHGTYVEQDQSLAALAKHNFCQLEVDNITVKHAIAEDIISNNNLSFDLIYIDPARRDEHKNRVFKLQDCTPNIVELLPKLLQKSNKVLIKTSPMMDIDLALKELTQVSEIHIVSVDNDCKEVLYLLERDSNRRTMTCCLNFIKGEKEAVSFLWEDRNAPLPDLSAPLTYLYEPNASIMKSGAHGTVVSQFGLKKLHQNTHLYTSNDLVKNFPGRAFKIKSVLPLSKKELKRALPGGKANIAVRNFKMDVDAIRKKTGIKPGGSDYLFACTLQDGQLKVIFTEKI